MRCFWRSSPPTSTSSFSATAPARSSQASTKQVWKNAAAEKPAFVVTIGDTIQGLDDKTADREWREVQNLFPPNIKLYLTPGNHDIWSDLSESLYVKYSGHPVHYSFDHEQAHFTILDNSREEQFSAAELAWLESDLRAHEKQPLKFVFSHRPSWIIEVLLKNPHSAIHQLAKKYGVQYVVSGHVHQMIHSNFDGITYLSMPSAGGHLRGTEKYEDGWFFAHTHGRRDRRRSFTSGSRNCAVA